MDTIAGSKKFRELAERRRSIRMFDNSPVPLAAVENCIAAACSAPSGANQQPWTFVLVGDKTTKATLRGEAEKIEQEFYSTRAPREWKEKLKPLQVTWEKPFLTQAPWLICVFAQNHGLDDAGGIIKHYYPRESVGIAVGFLVCALTQAGLGTVPYTPAPMGFLSRLLERPANERPYMILPVGYPHSSYSPPPIERKPLTEMLLRT